jgi:tripartite-type tricarboxylate transporter receptor subunit TctC
VVGFAPGAASDIITRIVAERLALKLAHPVVIENRAGADGATAAYDVMRAAPDGYRLLSVADAMLYTPQVVYDPRALTFVAPLGTYPAPWLLTAPGGARAPLRTIAHGNFAGKVCALQIRATLATPLVLVPYQGEALAFADVMAGRVDAMCSIPTASQPLVESGHLRVLKMGRIKAPFIPMSGLAAPPGTPREVVRRFAQAVKEVLQEPETLGKLRDQRLTPILMTPDEYEKAMLERIEFLNTINK